MRTRKWCTSTADCLQEERVKLHESEVLKKRKEWSSLTGRGLTEAQLKVQVGLQGAGGNQQGSQFEAVGIIPGWGLRPHQLDFPGAQLDMRNVAPSAE